MVVFGQKCLYSGKAAIFGQSGCIREKVFVLGQGESFRVKWLYSGKIVVFRQSGCTRAEKVVFGQK